MKRIVLLGIGLFSGVAGAGCAMPIPDGPGLEQVPVFDGEPARPRPMPPKDVPMHPFLGEQSVFHDDHYNSDATDFPAPLGLDPRVVTRAYGLCGTPRVDSNGRVITTCANPEVVANPAAPLSLLYLLDPDDLDVIAATPFFIGQFDGSNIGGGNYPHVLADDSIINGGSDGTLDRYAQIEDPLTGQISWGFSEPIDFSAGIPTGDAMFDVLPDFDGHYWYATTGGPTIGGVTVGVRDDDGTIRTIFLAGEKTENGLAVGEEGVYFVTDTALYRFDMDPDTGAPVQTWRETYVSVPKPPEAGVFSDGSGSTPTLLGRDYIAITDNDDPQVHLLVYRRDAEFSGDREICKVPLFEPGQSANDLSVIADRRSIVVTNWYGAPQPYTIGPGQTIPPFFGAYRDMAGGMTRVDIRHDESGCDIEWNNPQVRTNSVPKLSTLTGLIYYHGQRTDEVTESAIPPIDAYYMKTVSMKTGEFEFEVLAGTGPYYSGGGLTTTIGSNGAFYQATGGGIYKIQDAATGDQYYLRYFLMLFSKLYRKLWKFKSEHYSLQDVKVEPIIRTDCTEATLLPSLLSLSAGGPPICDVFGTPEEE